MVKTTTINCQLTDGCMELVKLHWQDTLAIRHRVLWPDQPPEFCYVEGDEDALHFGVKADKKLVCVASLYPNGHSARLRKFATLQEFQGKGIGSFMMRAPLEELQATEVTHFWFRCSGICYCILSALWFQRV